MSLQDNDMHKKLDVFKQKSLLGVSKGEAAHNLQVTASNDKFMVQLELPGFAPEDFSLKTKDDVIVLEAVHESGGEESTSRKYVKELKMPEGVARDQLASSYSADGILTISAPRVIKAPEGAEVKESMAAASKAFTTDDGKTAVKQDSQQASQQIATSTVSADGTSKSSMSFSSSSSSSMTSTSSSSGGPMPSLLGDMGSMMGGGQMALDMDMESMMAKMKGDMKLGGGSMMSGDMSKMMSSSSKMSSSSFSSSSSSTSTQMGSTMLGGGMQMPQMPSLGNMGGIGRLDIEELSTAGTDFSGPPEYTVTSPRPSVVAGNVAGEMKHRVQAAADYKAAESQDADHTVLLKLKEGDEYKLVLNMQSYSPENITVKLNDDASVLTVSATAGAGSTDDFKQTHKVPPGIDLDQMTSSFSSDGILVIKAPRKK
jgi:HSP20 family molecular chaperone IbpA